MLVCGHLPDIVTLALVPKLTYARVNSNSTQQSSMLALSAKRLRSKRVEFALRRALYDGKTLS